MSPVLDLILAIQKNRKRNSIFRNETICLKKKNEEKARLNQHSVDKTFSRRVANVRKTRGEKWLYLNARVPIGYDEWASNIYTHTHTHTHYTFKPRTIQYI